MKELLNKLIGKDDRFFRLLESAAEEAQNSALILEKLYKEVGGSDGFEKTLEELNFSRKKEKNSCWSFRNTCARLFHAD